MIVYGDPAYYASLTVLAPRLYSCISEVQYDKNPSLDQVRSILIRAGQMEQAVEDNLHLLPTSSASEIAEGCRLLTDAAARAFFLRWSQTQSERPLNEDLFNALREAAEAAQVIPIVHAALKVKVPEGYAFYTLYPEQYCVSALRWLQEHSFENQRKAAVVGIRSIGTSLSAVVGAVLEAHGWTVCRTTVRPTGDPFAREAEIFPDQVDGSRWALVVDEGPGMSGSSMVSAATALVNAGMNRGRITFFPGHLGEPGSAASDEVRLWWNLTPRYVTPLDELRWENRSLVDMLVDRTSRLFRSSEPVVAVEDFSAGQWRRFVFNSPSEWPAVAASFERTKYRVTLRDGRAVLWKFGGLAATEAGGNSLECFAPDDGQRESDDSTPRRLGALNGFEAYEWDNGEPLASRDLDSHIIRRIGRYIAISASDSFSREEMNLSHERATEMLVVNCEKAIGVEAAKCARDWSKLAALEGSKEVWPCFGDGRMSPHEWIKTSRGPVVKVDCSGHQLDHTTVGKQPFLWDVAGAIIEWKMDEAQVASFLEVVYDAKLPKVSPSVLHFYVMAYTSFRLGQLMMCRHDGLSSDEMARNVAACNHYRQELERLLDLCDSHGKTGNSPV